MREHKLPIRVPRTLSTFHPHIQRNAFRRSDARQKCRSIVAARTRSNSCTSLERVLPPQVKITLVAILLLFQSDIENRLLDRRAARKLVNPRVLIIGGFLDTTHTPRQKRHLRNYAAQGLACLFLKAGRVRPLWCNERRPNFRRNQRA